MSYNYDSVDCRRFYGPHFPAGALLHPGDFMWGEPEADDWRTLYIVLPGFTQPDAINVKKGDYYLGLGGWGWDGNEDKPTLSPSLHWKGYWHGMLKAGRLESLPTPVFIGPQP